jgi:hypothetical protein
VLKAMPNKLRDAHAKNRSKRTALCRFWGDGDAHARRLIVARAAPFAADTDPLRDAKRRRSHYFARQDASFGYSA